MIGAAHVLLRFVGDKLELISGKGGRGARVSCLKMFGLKFMNVCVFALFLLQNT